MHLIDSIGIIRRNSLGGGSSSGSQDKLSKGVTFATDMGRMVSMHHINKLNPVVTTIDFLVELNGNDVVHFFLSHFTSKKLSAKHPVYLDYLI